MADSEQPPLSDWLELMLAEITRRQEEAQAADVEQAARALQPQQPSTEQTPQLAPARARAPARRTTHA